MDFTYFFRILTRNKKIIIGASLLSLIVAVLFSFQMKVLYKSQSQISTGFTLSQEIKLSDNIFDIGQIDIKFNNVIENIKSPQVLNLLSYQLMIRELSGAAPFRDINTLELKKNKKLESLNLGLAKKILLDKYDSTLFLKPTVEIEKQLLELLAFYEFDINSISEDLQVSRYPRSDYINIEFLSTSPEMSAFVVNNLISEFDDYYNRMMSSRSIESMSSVDSIVRIKKADLDNRINDKNIFLQRSSSSLDPNIVATSKLNQVSSYESGMADEISRQQSFNYQLEQIEQQLKQISEVQGSSTTPTEGNNRLYSELKRQYNELNDEYVKKGSTDPAIKTRLADLESRMRLSVTTEGGAALVNNSSLKATLVQRKIDLEASLRSSNSKISFYRSKLGEANATIIQGSSSNRLAGALEQFNKEIELATAEYTNAKQRMTSASNMSDAGASNFKQTLYGQTSLKPEPSKKLLIIILAGISGFLISSLVFLIIAYFDQSIRSPLQFQRLTGLNLIGSINYINMVGTTLKDAITQIDANDANRNNIFRELFRKLRYEIENSHKRVILFTSTEPQQGKTTLTQCVALSLSLSSKKVLIIDTNFCNNDLTVYLKAKPTLERFSSSDAKVDFKKVEQMISTTRVPNVDIIGCRGGDYTPSEILPKNHILNYMNELLEHYDYVLFEGAPLNGFTDTRELAQYADGIVAIFSAKLTLTPIDKESIKYFKTVGDKFIGAILNQVDPDELHFRS
jgi:Mrp family chromosome partitioning ATPase